MAESPVPATQRIGTATRTTSESDITVQINPVSYTHLTLPTNREV